MYYIISKNNDPYFNLALEEYLIKEQDKDIFYLYQNAPSVIIGKNQNPYSEVNIEFTQGHDIKLVRRLSGGGSVYHDLGNLNYAFILKGKAAGMFDFKKYTKPIVDLLKSLNIDASFSGRNDILIEDQKISGTAQYISGNDLLTHGTLMFDVDLGLINQILSPNKDKLKSKGVKSVSSRVTNIKPYLTEELTFEQFRDKLTEIIPDQGEIVLDQKTIDHVNGLADAKRKSIEFILKNKKEYSDQVVEYIPGFGTIEIYFNLLNNKISEIEIFGEYFSKNSIDDFVNGLIGINYDEKHITDYVNGTEDFDNLFHKLTKEKMITLILKSES